MKFGKRALQQLLVTAALFCLAWVALAQVKRPPITPGTKQESAPAQAAPGAPGAPGAPPPQHVRPSALSDTGGFMLENVSLSELIDIMARRLKINYLVDPRFKGGSVTIHTYGQMKPTDLMPLLETILRVNGAAIVKTGELYRIVPVEKSTELPIPPTVNGKDFPDDESLSLNLVFLKYATAAEIVKLIQPFLGEGATMASYDPANLLILQDNNRNMKRTMELLSLFDSDSFVSQRVRLFEVSHGRPSELVKQLESVFKAFSLSDKVSAVKFIPVDRIATIIAMAPNPGIFGEVEKWLHKLDIPLKGSVGEVENYVYRLKYGRAETMAVALMALYTGNTQALMSLSAMANNMMGMGGVGALSGFGNRGYPYGGGGGYPGGYSGMNSGMSYGSAGTGYSGMGYGGAGYGGGYGGNFGAYGQNFNVPQYNASQATGRIPGASGATGTGDSSTDQTGSYLGSPNYVPPKQLPHIIPNPFDNTLLVQCTPEEWEQIARLLAQLDVAPRQILVEAKIFEVDLTGALQYGVETYLQSLGSKLPSGFIAPGQAGGFLGNTVGGLNLTGSLLVGHSRELLAALTGTELTTKARIISAPSLIATDSIPATMNVGESVPTLTSEAVAAGVQENGSSPFAQTISNTNTGVTLNVMARVNSSGIITMVINQEVSAPVPASSSSSIQSPSFSTRNFQTQITVQDGDTVAIGGIIQEQSTDTSSGIPFLHRLPVIGAAFGSKSHNSQRTELIVFFTPHVIYDTTAIADATDELKGQLTHLKKMMKNQ